MMKIKILCPCGYKAFFNKDMVVTCPSRIFEKYIKEEIVDGFKNEPPRKIRHCLYRRYGGPTGIECSKYTKEEYLKLTDVYWWCGASTDKKKVIVE